MQGGKVLRHIRCFPDSKSYSISVASLSTARTRGLQPDIMLRDTLQRPVYKPMYYGSKKIKSIESCNKGMLMLLTKLRIDPTKRYYVILSLPYITVSTSTKESNAFVIKYSKGF